MPKDTASATGGTDYANYLSQLMKKKKTKEMVFNKHHQVIYFPEFWKNRGDVNQYIEKIKAQLPNEISLGVKSIYAGKTEQKENG